MGILLQKTTIPFLAVLISSLVLSAMAALVIGYLAVRLGRFYFAILTLALAQIVYIVIIRWVSLTGGDQGLVGGLPGRAVELLGLTFDLTIPSNLYIFAFALAFLSILICRIVVESPFGYVLRAIRDNAERVNFIGINIRTHRLIVFVIAGTLGGLAGALMAVFVSGAYPDFAYWSKGAVPIVMILIGGVYSFFGPVLGAVLIVLVETYVVLFTDLWGLVTGGILLVIILVTRGGILDYLGGLRPAIRTLLKARWQKDGYTEDTRAV